MSGMVFRPVWPPTEREMAKFLFGLPPRRQWPLTYRRGPGAWIPLTALCRLVVWCGTSREPPDVWYPEGSWRVDWRLLDCNGMQLE